MTATHRRQTIQCVYLAYHLGANLPHIIKLMITLPFRPIEVDLLLRQYEMLLDGEIGFIRGVSA